MLIKQAGLKLWVNIVLPLGAVWAVGQYHMGVIVNLKRLVMAVCVPHPGGLKHPWW
jgi:hypothetical protein